LVLEGQTLDGEDLRLRVPLEIPAELPSSPYRSSSVATTRDSDASTLWALMKNKRLTYRFQPEDDATLEGLGTTFSIVNRAVALVGVHDEQRDVLVEGSVPVSLPMPKNVAQPTQNYAPMSPVAQMPVVNSPANPVGWPSQKSALPPMGAPGAAYGPPPGAIPGAPPPIGAPGGGLGGPPAFGAPPGMAGPPAFGAPLGSGTQLPPTPKASQQSSTRGSQSTGSFSREVTPMSDLEDRDDAVPEEAKAEAESTSLVSRVKRSLGWDGAKNTENRPPHQASAPKSRPKPEPKPTLKEMHVADLQRQLKRTQTYTNDEAGLRALLLQQNAEGLFSGDLDSTLLAVAALVSAGHTAREGLFRAELRRTLVTLRGKLASLKDDPRILAATTIALLTMPHGDPAPDELPSSLASELAGVTLADLPKLRIAISSTLSALTVKLGDQATAIRTSFQL